MGLLSNKIQREQLKPGDHIYSWRRAYIYAHHGIYIGEEKVIHFIRGAVQEIRTGTLLDRFIFSSSPSGCHKDPCIVCGYQSGFAGVIRSCLDCFLHGGELYLFEYAVDPAFFLTKARGGTCMLAKSDPQEHSLQRALYLLDKGFGNYDLFKNKCEDFAIYCKTGLLAFTGISIGRSSQTVSLLAATSVFVSAPLRLFTTSLPSLLAVGFGVYCLSRLVSDIGLRRDVVKVPVERLVIRHGLVFEGRASPDFVKTGS